MTELKSSVAVIGGGPAGLMAAETIARAGHAVTVFDRMPTLGRKFLMAGRGGLNLTHSEAFDSLKQRYGAASDSLRESLDGFTPAALQAWSESLGEPTFVGSSGRIFPKTFKASPLLRAWLRRLGDMGVSFALRHTWTGFSVEGSPIFRTETNLGADHKTITTTFDATVLALGGASWPKLGSDGSWSHLMEAVGIAVTPLKPSNCGFVVSWSDIFRERFEGSPLKTVRLSFAGRDVPGELLVTAEGLEGGALYSLSPLLRDALESQTPVTLFIDLKPATMLPELVRLLKAPRGSQSLSTFLRKAVNLSPVAIGLIQEALRAVSHEGAEELARLIKAVPVPLVATQPIANAISTAGGVSFISLDDHFMVQQRPGLFVAGEMLDWEAPTGGYLLQACLSTGVRAGEGVVKWLATQTLQQRSP